MLNKIVDVKVVAPHVLSMAFRVGYSTVHDFARYKNEQQNVAAPLADPDYFARVFLACGALTWPNGFDICPDALRLEIERNGSLNAMSAAE